jgi:hypothetical protein
MHSAVEAPRPFLGDERSGFGWLQIHALVITLEHS